MPLYSNMSDAGTLKAIVSSKAKVMSCLDLGSWDGGDAIQMKQAFPEAVVTAVEGSPLRIEIVRENCNPNGIRVVQAVVTGDGGKPLVMEHSSIGDEPHCGTIKGFKDGAPFPKGWHKINSIDVVSTGIMELLDDVGDVDLLHMDVEGAEYDILNKLLPTPKKPLLISMEVCGAMWFNNCGNRGELLELLNKHGYSVLHDGVTDMVFVLG